MTEDEKREHYRKEWEASKSLPPLVRSANGNGNGNRIRYALILVGVLIFTILAVIGITIYVPPASHATLITTVLAIVTPTTMALLSYLKSNENKKTLDELKVTVDGRLTQLLALTEKASLAEGKVQAIAEITANSVVELAVEKKVEKIVEEKLSGSKQGKP